MRRLCPRLSSVFFLFFLLQPSNIIMCYKGKVQSFPKPVQLSDAPKRSLIGAHRFEAVSVLCAAIKCAAAKSTQF